MLNELHIENIAVIARADVEFSPGLNVLTGETGAGKSIVIDALDAVLGGRASRELVRHGADKAVVRALFTGVDAAAWCEENDVDPSDGELLLQRRLTPDGKSVCRVNGTPVSASQLRQLGGALLDIHGQNDGRQLMDESRHRDYLDRFGSLEGPLADFAGAYGAWRAIRREMEQLSMDEADKARLADSLSAQIQELSQAELRPGEEAELTARRSLMLSGEKLSQAADAAYDALYGADGSAVERAGEAEAALSRAAELSEELSQALSELTDARCALEDAAERVRDFRESLDFSPEEFDRVETRLAQLRRLEKKYAADEAGLVSRLEEARARLEDLEYAGDRLIQLNRDLAAAEKTALEKGKALGRARRAAARELEAQIVSQLRELNMPSVRFAVAFTPVDTDTGFDAHGCDEIRFLMSANAGEEPGRIARIASGGELSRIMLAMKSVFAEKDAVPSLVFDEIDTGVSGIAAQRVGEKLALLSRWKQVLCVTHLPQIAAMADTHFVIEKTERDGSTFTRVLPLDRQGRIGELARLHGGENITERTRSSAAEQLEAASAFKTTHSNGGKAKL